MSTLFQAGGKLPVTFWTTSEKETDWLIPEAASVPAIVSGYVPAATPGEMSRVSIVLPAELTDVGLNAALTPDGRPMIE
jgi:hypothetical protein